jgi:hypothetical protein
VKTNLTYNLTALAFIALLQISGYAFAQEDSLFDTVGKGSADAARTLANPTAEFAPRLLPRRQMASRVVPSAVIQDPQATMVVPGAVSKGKTHATFIS